MAHETVQAAEIQMRIRNEAIAKSLLDQGMRSIEVRWVESEPNNLFSSVSSVLEIAVLCHHLDEDDGRDKTTNFTLQKVDEREVSEDQITARIRIATHLQELRFHKKSDEQFELASAAISTLDKNSLSGPDRALDEAKGTMWLMLGQYQGEAGFFAKAYESFDQSTRFAAHENDCIAVAASALGQYVKKLEQGLPPLEARNSVEWISNCGAMAPKRIST